MSEIVDVRVQQGLNSIVILGAGPYRITVAGESLMELHLTC